MRNGEAKMEKKEVQKLLKEMMKEYGFKSRGNHHYKIIEEDYLIGVSLDHHPFRKAYFIEYAALFLPAEEKMPSGKFCGFCDWNKRFLFTQNGDEEYLRQGLEKSIWGDGTELVDYLEYDKRDIDSAKKEISVNLEKQLMLIYDKEYVLNIYRKNLSDLLDLYQKDVEKIMKYGGFDEDEIERIKIKRRIKW